MAKAVNTRDKIIQLGRDFIQKLGYHSFKYQLIAKELNIKNAAIHHYFPAKEDLGVAVIEKDLEDFNQLAQSVKSSPSEEQAKALITVYSHYFSTGRNLCVIGACVSAYAVLPEKMVKAAKHYQDVIYNWLVNIFKEGLAKKEFQFTWSPEDLAALWVATLPGALQTAQARGGSYFKQVMEQLSKTLH